MTLMINGQEASFEKEGINITELLKKNNVEMPETVSVQVNGEFVKRENFDSFILHDKNEVDFLYFMGGGS